MTSNLDERILNQYQRGYCILRRVKNVKTPTICSRKEPNWVSKAVLSTDKDDVDLFLKILKRNYEIWAHFVWKWINI